jgi:hypothetical protein
MFRSSRCAHRQEQRCRDDVTTHFWPHLHPSVKCSAEKKKGIPFHHLVLEGKIAGDKMDLLRQPGFIKAGGPINLHQPYGSRVNWARTERTNLTGLSNKRKDTSMREKNRPGCPLPTEWSHVGLALAQSGKSTSAMMRPSLRQSDITPSLSSRWYLFNARIQRLACVDPTQENR